MQNEPNNLRTSNNENVNLAYENRNALIVRHTVIIGTLNKICNDIKLFDYSTKFNRDLFEINLAKDPNNLSLKNLIVIMNYSFDNPLDGVAVSGEVAIINNKKKKFVVYIIK